MEPRDPAAFIPGHHTPRCGGGGPHQRGTERESIAGGGRNCFTGRAARPCEARIQGNFLVAGDEKDHTSDDPGAAQEILLFLEWQGYLGSAADRSSTRGSRLGAAPSLARHWPTRAM